MKLLSGMLAIGVALAFSPAPAATTKPQGIYTVKIPGKAPGASQARTYLGIQLLPSTRYQGLAGTVSGSSLAFRDSFSPVGLQDPELKHYVHVLSGSGVGYVVDIEELRSNDILCATDLTSWITPWTSFLIRPHPRLADVFGADNRFGLGSGPDADHADNVVTWDPVAQQEKVYYFHATRARWELDGVEADARHAILRFPYGLFIVRRTTGTLRLALSGDVGSESVLLPVRPGANVFSLPLNLSASLDELITSDGDFSIRKGPNARQSDLLTFEEPFSGGQRGPFYYLSRPGADGWREVGVNDSSAPLAPLDLLSTLVLHRDGPAGYVLAKGSLVPGSHPPLPPAPEPGEPPLTGELPFPAFFPPDIAVTIETSIDLQTWTPHAVVLSGNGKATFTLPAGQTRAFYRLNVTPN